MSNESVPNVGQRYVYDVVDVNGKNHTVSVLVEYTGVSFGRTQGVSYVISVDGTVIQKE